MENTNNIDKDLLDQDLLLDAESKIFDSPYQIPAVPYQFSFQEPATPVMNGLLDLHDYVFFFIIVILSTVLLLLFQVVSTFAIREVFFFKKDSLGISEGKISGTRSISISNLMLFSVYPIYWVYKIIKGLLELRNPSFLKSLFKKGKKHILKKDLQLTVGLQLTNFIKNKSLSKFITLSTQLSNESEISSISSSKPFIMEKDSKKLILDNVSNNIVDHALRLLKSPNIKSNNIKSSNNGTLILLLSLSYLYNLDSQKSDYVVSVLKNTFSDSFVILSNTVKTANRLLSSLDSSKIFVYEDAYYDQFVSNFASSTFKYTPLSSIDNESLFFSNSLHKDVILSELFLSHDDNATLSTFDEEYVFDYTDYVRNLDYILTIYRSKSGDNISDALSSSLISANEESLKAQKGISLSLANPNSVNNFVSLSKSFVLEPFWFDFPYDTSWKGGDLQISGENEHNQSSKDNFDLEVENVLDILLSNINYHIFTSKYKQRFDFLYLMIQKGLPSISAVDKILETSFVARATSLSKNENKSLFTSIYTGDSYLTSLFSSRFTRLHHFLKIGYFNHSTRLEIIWTLIPIFIIALIITPSFFFMYAIDEDMESLLTVRVIGHQWFWSYVYSFPSYDFASNNHFFIENKDFGSLLETRNYSFDSYMLDDVSNGAPRLLATDSILVLPKYSHINCVVTSSDVLHSWALPSLGVKIDAVPGRLNRVDLFIEHEGMFFGQCSELCGVNHAFMPIQIEAVSLSDFFDFILKTFK